MARRQRLVAETQAVRDAGAEGLDHYVSADGQPVRNLVVFLRLQVQLDALLAAAPEWPGRLRPQWTAARRLDLHDLSAEIGKDLGHPDAGDRVAQPDHPEAVEG